MTANIECHGAQRLKLSTHAGAYGFVGGSGVALWKALTARPEDAVEDITLWQLRTALLCAFGGKAVGLTLSVVYATTNKLRAAVSDDSKPKQS